MKPPVDKDRVTKDASRKRATGRAQARTRSQILRPGPIAESGTAGYSLAKLVASQSKAARTYITTNLARSAASKKVYQTRVARDAARKRAELKRISATASGVAALAYGAGVVQEKTSASVRKRIVDNRVAAKKSAVDKRVALKKNTMSKKSRGK